MTGVPIHQMADRVSALLEQKLRLRGAGLPEKLRKSGRSLPRRVRHAAEALRDAAEMAQNPKLLLQVDQEATAKAYDVCVRHLNAINSKALRRGLLLNIAASVAFAILAVAVMFLAVVVWRRLI